MDLFCTFVLESPNFLLTILNMAQLVSESLGTFYDVLSMIQIKRLISMNTMKKGYAAPFSFNDFIFYSSLCDHNAVNIPAFSS